MITSFRCPYPTKERIDALVEAGLYPDFSGFCVAALENQLLLEEAHSKAPERGAVPKSKKRVEGTVSPRELPKKDMDPLDRGGEVTSTDRANSSGLALTRGELEEVKEGRQLQLVASPPIPLELVLSRLSEEPPFSLPSTFPDVFEPGQEIPVERWMFGQYNRLLPAKVSVRALSVISTEGKDAVMLEAVAPRVAEAAAKFGDYLRFLDRRFANHRDDALGTAFPDGSVEGQKGRVRYQNHFVGHTVKGEQGGMLIGLKLAVIHVIKNKPHIFPTIAGWELARFVNPLLDTPISENPLRLSGEEVTFLLRHIRENVPVEFFAYRVMLSLISKGKTTPELVNQGLARYLSPRKKPEDEQDFLSTQRSGALGRMTDLGLVHRQRQGTRITYHLTPEGERFLADVGPIPVAA